MPADQFGSRLHLDDYPLWSAILWAARSLVETKGSCWSRSGPRHLGVDTDIDVTSDGDPVCYESLPPSDEHHMRLHKIRVPVGWQDRVAHLGFRDGRLDHSIFVLDCVLAGHHPEGAPIFEIDIVRQSRGYDVKVDRIYVVRWLRFEGDDEDHLRWHRRHAESRHASLKAAQRAKPNDRVRQIYGERETAHRIDMGFLQGLNMSEL